MQYTFTPGSGSCLITSDDNTVNKDITGSVDISAVSETEILITKPGFSLQFATDQIALINYQAPEATLAAIMLQLRAVFPNAGGTALSTLVLDINGETFNANIQGYRPFTVIADFGDGLTKIFTGGDNYNIYRAYAGIDDYAVKLIFPDSDNVAEIDLQTTGLVSVLGLDSFRKVTSINLSGNLAMSSLSSVAYPKSLRTLILSNMGMADLLTDTPLPNGLQTLVLNGNFISSFNTAFALPGTLKELNLSYNDMTTFDPMIALPGSLERLILSYNLFTVFGPSLPLPTSLVMLYLDNCALNDIAVPAIAPLVNLTYLALNDNNLIVDQINDLLVALDANDYTAASFVLSAQDPAAAPSGAGITSKNNLIAAGNTVLTD
jgi:hypothetical protein